MPKSVYQLDAGKSAAVQRDDNKHRRIRAACEEIQKISSKDSLPPESVNILLLQNLELWNKPCKMDNGETIILFDVFFDSISNNPKSTVLIRLLNSGIWDHALYKSESDELTVNRLKQFIIMWIHIEDTTFDKYFLLEFIRLQWKVSRNLRENVWKDVFEHHPDLLFYKLITPFLATTHHHPEHIMLSNEVHELCGKDFHALWNKKIPNADSLPESLKNLKPDGTFLERYEESILFVHNTSLLFHFTAIHHIYRFTDSYERWVLVKKYERLHLPLINALFRILTVNPSEKLTLNLSNQFISGMPVMPVSFSSTDTFVKQVYNQIKNAQEESQFPPEKFWTVPGTLPEGEQFMPSALEYLILSLQKNPSNNTLKNLLNDALNDLNLSFDGNELSEWFQPKILVGYGFDITDIIIITPLITNETFINRLFDYLAQQDLPFLIEKKFTLPTNETNAYVVQTIQSTLLEILIETFSKNIHSRPLCNLIVQLYEKTKREQKEKKWLEAWKREFVFKRRLNAYEIIFGFREKTTMTPVYSFIKEHSVKPNPENFTKIIEIFKRNPDAQHWIAENGCLQQYHQHYNIIDHCLMEIPFNHSEDAHLTLAQIELIDSIHSGCAAEGKKMFLAGETYEPQQFIWHIDKTTYHLNQSFFDVMRECILLDFSLDTTPPTVVIKNRSFSYAVANTKRHDIESTRFFMFMFISPCLYSYYFRNAKEMSRQIIAKHLDLIHSIHKSMNGDRSEWFVPYFGEISALYCLINLLRFDRTEPVKQLIEMVLKDFNQDDLKKAASALSFRRENLYSLMFDSEIDELNFDPLSTFRDAAFEPLTVQNLLLLFVSIKKYQKRFSPYVADVIHRRIENQNSEIDFSDFWNFYGFLLLTHHMPKEYCNNLICSIIETHKKLFPQLISSLTDSDHVQQDVCLIQVVQRAFNNQVQSLWSQESHVSRVTPFTTLLIALQSHARTEHLDDMIQLVREIDGSLDDKSLWLKESESNGQEGRNPFTILISTLGANPQSTNLINLSKMVYESLENLPQKIWITSIEPINKKKRTLLYLLFSATANNPESNDLLQIFNSIQDTFNDKIQPEWLHINEPKGFQEMAQFLFVRLHQKPQQNTLIRLTEMIFTAADDEYTYSFFGGLLDLYLAVSSKEVESLNQLENLIKRIVSSSEYKYFQLLLLSLRDKEHRDEHIQCIEMIHNLLNNDDLWLRKCSNEEPVGFSFFHTLICLLEKQPTSTEIYELVKKVHYSLLQDQQKKAWFEPILNGPYAGASSFSTLIQAIIHNPSLSSFITILEMIYNSLAPEEQLSFITDTLQFINKEPSILLKNCLRRLILDDENIARIWLWISEIVQQKVVTDEMIDEFTSLHRVLDLLDAQKLWMKKIETYSVFTLLTGILEKQFESNKPFILIEQVHRSLGDSAKEIWQEEITFGSLTTTTYANLVYTMAIIEDKKTTKVNNNNASKPRIEGLSLLVSASTALDPKSDWGCDRDLKKVCGFVNTIVMNNAYYKESFELYGTLFRNIQCVDISKGYRPWEVKVLTTLKKNITNREQEITNLYKNYAKESINSLFYGLLWVNEKLKNNELDGVVLMISLYVVDEGLIERVLSTGILDKLSLFAAHRTDIMRRNEDEFRLIEGTYNDFCNDDDVNRTPIQLTDQSNTHSMSSQIP